MRYPSRSASPPGPTRRVYPVCIGGKRAAPPEDCRGAWGYLERLDHHRLYPPLEAMGVVAEAINTLLAADPQTSVREALGDLDEFREAVDCLEAYQAFQPEHFERDEILILSDFVVHSLRPPKEEAMSRLWSQLGWYSKPLRSWNGERRVGSLRRERAP